MSFFGKKVNEDQLEQAILFASMLAGASERDNGRLESAESTYSFVDFAFSRMTLKPTTKQRATAFICINALLAEHDFINYLIDYRLKNGTNQLPPNARSHLLSVISKTTEEFEAHQAGYEKRVSGESFENAIVISKLPPSLAVQTEYAHITSKHGMPDDGWELELQELIEAKGQMYDVLSIKVGGNIKKTYYFNITQCMSE